MLYIRIEIWPFGKQERARLLGEMHIANTGESDVRSVGHYTTKIFRSPEYSKRPGVWKQGEVKGFPRLKLGPWDLLFRALRSTVGNRTAVW